MELGNIIKLITKKPFTFLATILTCFVILSTSALSIISDGWKPIKSDGIGYHAYLPSVIIYRNFGLKEVVMEQKGTELEDSENWYGIALNTNTGKYSNQFPIGTALLSMPFFITADIATQITGGVRDGFSFYYQVFNIISALFYLLLGNYFLFKLLNKKFSTAISLLSLIIINFGTNLIHYATYDPSFSHVYAFSLFALLLFFSEKFSHKKSFKRAVLIGFILGLIVLVRQINVIMLIVIVPAIINIKRPLQSIKQNLPYLITLIVTVLLVFLPQMLYWKHTSDNFLVFSYVGSYFNLFQPEVLNVLFSVRKGLIFWTPVIIFAFLGFIIMHKAKDKRTLCYFSVIMLQIYIVASWWAWFYGYSYGHRGFVEYFAMLAIPLAYFIQYALKNKKKLLYKAAFLLIIFFSFLSLFQMQQYWRGIIDGDGTTLERYQQIFLRPCIDTNLEILRCD